MTAVLTAQSQLNFTTAFDEFIAKNVSVTFNGVNITRNEYEQQLLGDAPPESLAVIDILNIVQAAEFNQGASQVCFKLPTKVNDRPIDHLGTEIRSGWLVLQRDLFQD